MNIPHSTHVQHDKVKSRRIHDYRQLVIFVRSFVFVKLTHPISLNLCIPQSLGCSRQNRCFSLVPLVNSFAFTTQILSKSWTQFRQFRHGATQPALFLSF